MAEGNRSIEDLEKRVHAVVQYHKRHRQAVQKYRLDQKIGAPDESAAIEGILPNLLSPVMELPMLRRPGYPGIERTKQRIADALDAAERYIAVLEAYPEIKQHEVFPLVDKEHRIIRTVHYPGIMGHYHAPKDYIDAFLERVKAEKRIGDAELKGMVEETRRRLAEEYR